MKAVSLYGNEYDEIFGWRTYEAVAAVVKGKEFVEINTVARIKNIEVPPRDPADTRSILFGVFIFEIISSLIDLPPTHPDFASDLK